MGWVELGGYFGGDKVTLIHFLGDERLLGLEPCLFRIGGGLCRGIVGVGRVLWPCT